MSVYSVLNVLFFFSLFLFFFSFLYSETKHLFKNRAFLFISSWLWAYKMLKAMISWFSFLALIRIWFPSICWKVILFKMSLIKIAISYFTICTHSIVFVLSWRTVLNKRWKLFMKLLSSWVPSDQKKKNKNIWVQ